MHPNIGTGSRSKKQQLKVALQYYIIHNKLHSQVYLVVCPQALQKASQVIAEIRETNLW